jgi:hypothetical protein
VTGGMGVLQQADEERARRKDNPTPLEVAISNLREATGPGGWSRADVLAVCDAAESAERALDHLYSQEPCPDCGCGVIAGCYGCAAKAMREQRDDLLAALKASHPSGCMGHWVDRGEQVQCRTCAAIAKAEGR